jgi:outer membrane protein
MIDKQTRIKKASLLLVFLMLLAATAFSQTTDTSSLRQCIDIAIKNNQNIQNKQLDELISQTKIAETRADLYPQIKAKSSYQYYLNVPKSLVSSALFGGNPSELAYGEFQVPQNINASVDMSWQVYNPAILTALKINKFAKTMSETATKDKLEAVVYDVSATYLNIQINELQLDLTRSNIANLKKNLDITTKLFNQGVVLRSDMDNINLSIANLETVLNNQLNGIQQLYHLLNIYMGQSPSSPLIIEKYKQEVNNFNYLTSIDTMSFTKRTGYISLQQAGDLLILEQQSIKAAYKPTVNLVSSLGVGGLNDNFKFFGTYNNQWNPVNLIQLNFEIPIFDGKKKRTKLLNNKYQLQQNSNSLQNLKNTFQMEQMNALNNYNLYIKDVEYQTKNVALANKLYNQKLLEYKNASASLNDMISVENTLKTAQSNYLNALIKMKVAALDIKKANGELIKN